MLTYSLILNILLVIVTVVLGISLLFTKKQVKLLFLRAWGFELALMDVYNKTIDKAVKEEIQSVFKKITPI